MLTQCKSETECKKQRETTLLFSLSPRFLSRLDPDRVTEVLLMSPVSYQQLSLVVPAGQWNVRCWPFWLWSPHWHSYLVEPAFLGSFLTKDNLSTEERKEQSRQTEFNEEGTTTSRHPTARIPNLHRRLQARSERQDGRIAEAASGRTQNGVADDEELDKCNTFGGQSV